MPVARTKHEDNRVARAKQHQEEKDTGVRRVGRELREQTKIKKGKKRKKNDNNNNRCSPSSSPH